MNDTILNLAREANKVCIDPVIRVDPRFLTEFARLVVNECVLQTMMECQKQELDTNPFARRMWEFFDIDYEGRQNELVDDRADRGQLFVRKNR